MEPAPSPAERPLSEAAGHLGDLEALELLRDLVALAPTNLEDPIRDRWEKPNYPAAAQHLASVAAAWGLASRVVTAAELGAPAAELHGVARPNVVVDLDVGARERLLLLAHYDVVPVPEEQLTRWRSPPHRLTYRADGRLYGRGANDDLGSGTVASLLAMRRLLREGGARRNVRLLLCCDEETGGEGGVEAFKGADDRMAPLDPERFLSAEVALIPDGSPHTTAASSGLAFVDVVSESSTLDAALDLGAVLIELDGIASSWRSTYPSEDWPDHGAPAPVITGRATVTQFDLEAPTGPPGALWLRAARAETDATNQVAEAVTLVLAGPERLRSEVSGRLAARASSPFRISTEPRTDLAIPPDCRAIQVVGKSTHAGYPHRGANPVPAALALLRDAVGQRWVDGSVVGRTTFSVDVRLTPEMTLEAGLGPILKATRDAIAAQGIRASAEALPSRARPGYFVRPDHPEVVKFQRIAQATLHSPGIFGEYGGTDASSLASRKTSTGAPLPAIVFGSMDRSAHIHEAEESADPALIAGVVETIVRFAREP